MAGFFDAVGKLFSGENVALAAILGVPMLVSAQMTSRANVEAARIGAEAARVQADEIRSANEGAQARYEEQRAVTAPGVSRLRSVVSAPEGLTPEQIAAREELRRQTTNTVSRSGLRGSGRATVAAIKKVESDFTNQAIAANRARGDTAATTLAGSNLATYGQQAGIDQSTGRAVGDAAMTAGLASAGATTANANMAGRALGDLAGIIASDVKGRESRYADRLAKQESDARAREERL